MRRSVAMGDAGTGTAISLWLMPEGAARERLGRWIERLAERLGTLPFPPHVTLVPGVALPDEEALQTASAVAADLDPFSVHLDGVDGRDEYFRCLYARVDASSALLEAHARAARALGRAPDPSFEPHLSLVYGTLPREVKTALAVELLEPTRLSFEVLRLHVLRTAGGVEEWSEIGAFALGAPGP